MHRQFRPLICAMILVITQGSALAQGSAAPAVKLRYTFTKGQKLYFKFEESTKDLTENALDHSTSESLEKKENGIVLEVANVFPSGDADMTFKFDYISVTKTIAKDLNMVIDTRRPIKETNAFLYQVGPQAQPVIELFEAVHRLIGGVFVNSPIRFTVNNQGRITKVAGFDELWEKYRGEAGKILTDPAKRASLDALIEGFFGEKAIKNILSHNFFVPLPTEAVTKGHQWKDSFQVEVGPIVFPIMKTYRLDNEPGGPLYQLAVTMEFGNPPATEEAELKIAKNQVNGTVTVDPKFGVIKGSQYGGQFQFEGYTPASAAQKLIIRVTSDVKGSVVTTVIP